MKKPIQILCAAFTLTSGVINAQADKKIQPCITYEVMDQVFKEDPAAKQRYKATQTILNSQKEEYEKNLAASKTLAPPVYTIPVVFHILHQGGSENISDATINQALKWLNDDYARTSADANTTVPPFNTSFIDSEIKFVLAKLDPTGNCTNGIIRKYDSRTVWNRNPSGAFSYLYNGITWDPTKYMNVIVVKDIVAAPGQIGIVVGYTFKPGVWPTGSVQDAIVFNHNFLNSMVDARSLSHEAGHWFNLPHTWGNTNNPGIACGDDGIDDTPITKGEASGCPSSSVSACTQTNPAMVGLNNVQNIMNYSDCPRNFTTGQTNVMRAALASATGGRSNLWSNANLIATGINNTVTCLPIAGFASITNKYKVCSGASLTMRDASYNAAITSYSWSGPNSVVFANSNASITNVVFNTPGIVTITLTVGNAQGNSASTRTVDVDGLTAAITGPTIESFEGTNLPVNWSITNGSGVGWEQTNLASKDGANSYFVDGPLSSAGQSDLLQMPMMDILNNQGGTFEFAYAYARNSTTHNDNLIIEGSLDCGATWKIIKQFNASTLASGSGGIVPVTNSVFIPTGAQWKTYSSNIGGFGIDIDWFDFSNSARVMVRFNFIEDATNGAGNRIYIDKVNFAGNSVGINELTKSIGLGLFPNPTKGNSTVKFTLGDPSKISIEVVDVLGKVVIPVESRIYPSGEHSLPINSNSTLNKGIYFVNINLNGINMSRKLIVE